MTLELKLLTLSILLGLVQIVLASHAASIQRGYVWTASSRDAAMPALTGLAGRLARALQNFVETFPLFAAGVLRSWMTEWGVQLYFWGRIAYLALRSGGLSAALSCMERGDAWHRPGPFVTGLSQDSVPRRALT